MQCVAYRILCAAVSRKMAPHLDAIVNDEQRAYVPSRQIQDCIAETLTAAHHAKQHSAPLAIVSIDFQKAFDQIDQGFLTKMLRRLGCTDDFVRDVEVLLSHSQGNMVINGVVGRAFPIGNGVPQGNSLSSTLYILAISVIPRLLLTHGVQGYTVLHDEAPRQLRCSMFADNLCVFASSATDIDNTIKALDTFELASKQKHDLSKMTIIKVVESAANSLVPPRFEPNVMQGSASHRLLGVYIDAAGAVHHHSWHLALEKLDSAIAKLNRLRLDIRSRALCICSIAAAPLLYVASVLPMPQAVLNRDNTTLPLSKRRATRRLRSGNPGSMLRRPLASRRRGRHCLACARASCNASYSILLWRCETD